LDQAALGKRHLETARQVPITTPILARQTVWASVDPGKHAQNVTGCGLLLQRLGELAVTIPQFLGSGVLPQLRLSELSLYRFVLAY
jgi:hypothetical protein